MFDKVLAMVRTHSLLTAGDRAVIGVSGGPDSVALLHIMLQMQKEYNLYLHVAHLNHQFRGKDADEDARFVADLAREWGVDCTVRVVDVPALSREKGLSPEDAGRQARYALFSGVAKENGCNRIIVAHHRDDQAETILLNLIRGAGLEGLTGMKPIREDRIIRPLLHVSRQEVEAYCQEHKLHSRQDASNLQTDYRRNKIRLQLIPFIEKEFNPQFRKALGRTAVILADENEMMQSLADEIVQQQQKMSENECSIPVDILRNEPVALQRRIVRKMIANWHGSTVGLAYEHIEQIIRLVRNMRTGKRIPLPGGLEAFIEYGELGIRSLEKMSISEPVTRAMVIPGITEVPELDYCFEANYQQQDMLEKNRDTNIIYVDPEKVELPLSIRTRKDGDRLSLPGGKGSSKVKKILIDMKIRQAERGLIPLLVDAKDRIIWIVGMKTSDFCVPGPAKKGDIRIQAKRYIQGG